MPHRQDRVGGELVTDLRQERASPQLLPCRLRRVDLVGRHGNLVEVAALNSILEQLQTLLADSEGVGAHLLEERLTAGLLNPQLFQPLVEHAGEEHVFPVFAFLKRRPLRGHLIEMPVHVVGEDVHFGADAADLIHDVVIVVQVDHVRVVRVLRQPVHGALETVTPRPLHLR